MSNIFVTRRIPGDFLSKLTDAGHEVTVSEFDRPLTEEELVNGVAGKDAIISLLTDRIDADLMDAAGPQLKIISNYAVGFDNVDVKAAGDRGIVVTNTPSEEVNQAVAEHTWALILALSRRVVEADEAVRRGGYKGWDPGTFLGKSLVGKTFGIIGLGRIGSLVAQRAGGYDMKVLYYKRKRDLEAEKNLNVVYSDLDELLVQSDFVSLHVPLTDETRGMINKDTLQKMKQGSYLINTARGQIIKEDDLVEEIRKGRLGGVALDVFENEPNIHPELIGMENVILTPHIGSATIEARNKMGQQAADAVISYFDNQKPENLVDPQVWEKRRK